MTDLPKLPEPLKHVAVAGDHDATLRPALEDYYDAAQMHAYAEAALASPGDACPTPSACGFHGECLASPGDAQREEIDRMDAIVAAYNAWPKDLRAKLSLHDLRRMTGWTPSVPAASVAGDADGPDVFDCGHAAAVRACGCGFCVALTRPAEPGAAAGEGDAKRWRKLCELVDTHHSDYWYVHPGAGCDRIKGQQQLCAAIDAARAPKGGDQRAANR